MADLDSIISANSQRLLSNALATGAKPINGNIPLLANGPTYNNNNLTPHARPRTQNHILLK